MQSAPASPTAYSYIRFSSKKQEEGDSIRRQTELTAAWAKRNSIHLDTSLAPDRGVSAFRGKNRDLGALGAFLRLVENGRVLPGSYLVVESLDRLTREEIQPALLLVLSLLQKGVRVVQLKPVETTYDSKSDTTPIILMLVELSRGHSESKVKSDRVCEAWDQRRKNARAGKGVFTHRLPLWVEERGGKLVAISERAAVVRRIFELSLSGMGLYAIMTTLTKEKVPAFGRSGRWSVTYLDMILSDRRALGEFQPRLRSGETEGQPLANYFPAIVTEEQWERVRMGARKRHRKPGRIGNRVNVFQGLLKSARDGFSYVVASPSGRNTHATIRSASYRLGVGHNESFPLDTFERAVLSCLREIDPRELLTAEPAGGPDAAMTLVAELVRVEASISAITAEMEEHGESPALFKRLREKETTQRECAAKLAAARQKSAHPLSESWSETKSLLATLDAAPDHPEARLRLREALRRIVDEIRVLVVPARRDRLAAVQIWFAGEAEAHRDYLILHRAGLVAGNGGAVRRPSSWSVLSNAWTATAGEIDLRKPSDAKAVEKYLAAVDVETLAAAIEAKNAEKESPAKTRGRK
jgi:DNA invertase Pin-like site-specific DNA recombinase